MTATSHRPTRKSEGGRAKAAAKTTLLASSPIDKDRRKAGGAKSLSEADLRRLCADEDWKVRAAAAARSDLPEDVALRLASDAEWHVAMALARAWSTRRRDRSEGSEPIASALLSGPHVAVRTIVAETPYILPRGILDALTRDSSADVRKRAATRFDMGPGLLGRVAKDACADVRQAAAENPFVSDETLVWMASDKDMAVQYAVLRRRVAAATLILASSGGSIRSHALKELAGFSRHEVLEALAYLAEHHPGRKERAEAVLREAAAEST